MKKILYRLIYRFRLHNGCSAYWKSELEEAKEWFQKSLLIHPTNSMALYNLGIVHYELGNFGEAEKYIWMALALDLKLGKIWLEDCSWRYYWMLEPHVDPRVGHSYYYPKIIEKLGGYKLVEHFSRETIQKLEGIEGYLSYKHKKAAKYYPYKGKDEGRVLGKMLKEEEPISNPRVLS